MEVAGVGDEDVLAVEDDTLLDEAAAADEVVDADEEEDADAAADEAIGKMGFSVMVFLGVELDKVEVEDDEVAALEAEATAV